MYLAVLGALVALILLVKTVAPRRELADLSAAQLGYLKDRRRGAVVSTLIDLYLHGAVKAGAPGTVLQDGDLPDDSEPLARTLHRLVIRPNGPRTLKSARPVINELSTIRDDLASAGLVLGTWRWVTVRLALCGVAVLAVVRLTSGPAEFAVPFTAACAVITIGGWFFLRSHRTLHGALTLRGTWWEADTTDRRLQTFIRRGGLLDGGRRSTETYGDGPISPTGGASGASALNG